MLHRVARLAAESADRLAGRIAAGEMTDSAQQAILDDAHAASIEAAAAKR
jgi:hypothetical protein